MTQTTIRFDEEQRLNLERVSDRIAPIIVEFFQAPRRDRRFHMIELVAYVGRHVPNVAPDSTSRVMRMLRQQHVINYRVINRSESLYEIIP